MHEGRVMNMTSAPTLLSIGIATLNRPPLLARAVETVFAAARFAGAAPNSVELIVSDMGGSPETKAVLDRLAASAPEQLCFRRQVDTSIPSGIANWRECLRLARGRYYMMIGDDDELDPEALAKLLPIIAESHVACFLGSAFDIDGEGRPTRRVRQSRAELEGERFFQNIVCRRVTLRWCAFVCRRDILVETGAFDRDFPGGGDGADAAAIFSSASAGRAMLLDFPIGRFRVHGANDSRRLSIDYHVNHREELAAYVAKPIFHNRRMRELCHYWLADGIFYQIVRWRMQNIIRRHELLALLGYADQFASRIDWGQIQLTMRLQYHARRAIIQGLAMATPK